MKNFILFIIMCVVSSLSFSNPQSGPWTCLSFDYLHRGYQGVGTSTRNGMASARLNCMKHVKRPSECRVSYKWCKQGYSAPDNRFCEAVDEVGKRFEARGKQSCELALKQCEAWQQTLLPDNRHHCLIIHR